MKRIIALVLTVALVMSCGISSAFAAENGAQPRDSANPTDSGYTVKVINGSTDNETATKGTAVTITAGSPEKGKVFDKWETSGVNLDHPTETPTTFSMPANDVTVTATYKDKTVNYDGLIGVG